MFLRWAGVLKNNLGLVVDTEIVSGSEMGMKYSVERVSLGWNWVIRAGGFKLV